MLGRYGMRYSRVSASTQQTVKHLLDIGEQPPVVVITEEQTAGRGRLDRAWTAPPFSSVLMSVGLPPSVHNSTFTLKVGVVVARSLATRGVHVQLKWPNDIVVVQDERVRKLGGILAEMHRDHVIVGIGLNIDMDEAELPTPDAISCRQLGTTPRRERLIDDIVDGLAALPGAVSMTSYRALCATIGAEVEVRRIVGEALRGTAIAVDDDGALVVRDLAGAEHVVTVGDVQHVRPAASA